MILIPGTKKLPGALKKYENKDFVLQQRALFIYYLAIALIITVVLFIFTTINLQKENPLYGKPYVPVLMTIIGVLLSIIISLWTLIRGHYSISATLLFLTTLTGIWIIMIFDKNDNIIRLDTIVLVLSALSMLPLLIKSRKEIIITATVINLGIFLVFAFGFREEFAISEIEFSNYLIDVSVALLFMGVVNYHIFSINNAALNRARTDIEEREKAETALAKSEKKYRDMTDLLPAIVFETDTVGYLTYINKAGLEFFGYSANEIVKGVSLYDVFKQHDKLKADFRDLEKKQETLTDELIITRMNGETCPVNIIASAICDKRHFSGFRGIIIDISEKKAYEEKLLDINNRYKTLIESFPDIIMLSDLQGNIIYGNEQLQKITGITKEDYKNPDRKARIHPDDLPFVSEKLTELLETNKTQTEIIENRFIDSWGKVHWFSGKMAKLYLNDQILIQTVTRDITDKKLYELELDGYRNQLEQLVKEKTNDLKTTNEELQTANEELHSINSVISEQKEELEQALSNLKNTQAKLIQSEKMASLGTLTAGIAHEINNPLNFINGGLNILNDTLNELNNEFISNELRDKIDFSSRTINSGLMRTMNIVEALMTFSYSGKSKLQYVDIHKIIDNTLLFLKSKMENRITVDKNYQLKKGLFLYAEKMHQILLNIIDNAIYATKQQQKYQKKLSVSTFEKNDMAVVKIQNSGDTISPEVMNHIFDPFFTTKDPGKGTGLGLSLCYSLMQEHQGHIYAENMEDGVCMTLELPIDRDGYKM
jgi:PAS domain S-box-containing protein